MPMTMDEIKDAADMAETWPGSGTLNWGEVGWRALEAWVCNQVCYGDVTVRDLDVESAKGSFERWWNAANTKAECAK